MKITTIPMDAALDASNPNIRRNSMKTEKSGGIGFLGLLGLLFIGLKLGGIIDWSWWLVLLPLYGPLLFIVAAIFMVTVLVISVEILERK